MSFSSRRAWASSTCSPVSPCSSRGVVAGLDDLGLDDDPVAVEVGDDVELVDVEPEVVEPLDPLLDPPHLAGREHLLRGQLGPQRVVPLRQQLHDLERLHVVVERVAGLEVEQLGVDVLAAHRDVVLAHALRQHRLELAGLRVDEVRREPAGAASEQHVRERHVAPVEVGEVQPDQQHHQGVDERGQVLRLESVREQAAVRQREAEVLGHQRGRQLVAALVGPAGDHALRDDGRQTHPLQVAQHAVLAEGDLLDRLLHGVHPLAQAHDPDDVAGEAAGKGYDVAVVPVLQRGVPGQRHDRRIRATRHDPQDHAPKASGRADGHGCR